MYQDYGLFIDGGWRLGGDGQTTAIASPVTEQSLGDCPVATADDTRAAVAAAVSAMETWSACGAFGRAEALHAVADEMTRATDRAVRMISTETGKPTAQSAREWALSIDQFRWYAEEARRIYGRIIESRAPGGRLEVHHTPIGVSAAFTAWNFPAVLIARKVAPALAAGCPVIVRPSSQTPGSAMVIIDCLRAADLPPGLVNLVIGPTAQTYTPLMAAPEVRKVSLTGSTRVGQQMIRDAADTMKKVSMELGGNAPLIIFDDADLETAIEMSVAAKYANAGQVCVAPDRFFVHDRVHDAFVDGFASRAKALKLGDGLNADTQMGPLISGRRLDEVAGIVADAVAAGGNLITGGHPTAEFNAGHFFEPTVITDIADDARVVAEENFAPVAAITRFTTDDEVFSRANAVPVGLAAYAFTRDPARARATVARLNAGMVGINSFALAAAEAPFGGTKYSGMGREGGTEGIADYLECKLAQMSF